MDKAMLDYNIKVRLPIVILVALISYFTTFFYSFDERNLIGYTPDQPINFSHKLHAGELGLDCRYCHVSVEKARHASIPSMDTCMNCHSHVKKVAGAEEDSAELAKLREAFEKGESIHWKRIHRTPEYAYFNHSVHIAKGLDCTECHGSVKTMDKVGLKKKITMGRCIECHRKPHKTVEGGKVVVKNQGPQHCFACHR